MAVTAIVFSCIFFAASLLLLGWRQIASPCCAFMGLLILSMAKTAEGYPLLPLNSAIIFGWLCITVVITAATLMQPRAVRNSNKGIWYMAGGAIAGLAIGLLGYSITSSIPALYAIMIVATAAGTFFGFLLYGNTPQGKIATSDRRLYFRYFLAKGFPTAITVMQCGVVLVMLIAIHNYYNPI